MPAPDFTAQTVDGSSLTLSSLRGRPVYLTFFRFISCPFCAMRVHELAERAPRWAARGVRTIAVFQSTVTAVAPSAERFTGRITILCDPGEELYRLYRLETSVLGTVAQGIHPRFPEAIRALRSLPSAKEDAPTTKTRMPADFLIASDGNLAVAHYAPTVPEQLSFAEVDRFALHHDGRDAETRPG